MHGITQHKESNKIVKILHHVNQIRLGNQSHIRVLSLSEDIYSCGVIFFMTGDRLLMNS